MVAASKRRTPEDDDGDESGANQGRAKRARTSNSEDDSREDGLRRLAIVLDELRREAASKATTARQVTLPRLILQLRCLLNRLENVDDKMTVLLDKIPAAMEDAIACTHDLLQWVALAQPPMSTGGNPGPDLLDKVKKIAKIERKCLMNLAMIPDYHMARGLLVQQFASRPDESEECQQELESFDRANALDWRHAVEVLLHECEWLANFIDNYRQFLEGTDAQVNDVDHMYQ